MMTGKRRKTRVSLIISTYNWPDALMLCLQSVLSQSVLPDEVIIADDGSGMSTSSVIKAFEQDFERTVKHVWQEDKGFRKSLILNKAIKEATGEYIVQIDGDVILDRNFIADHLFVAEEGCFVRGSRGMLTPEKTRQILLAKSIDIHCWSPGIRNRNNVLRSQFFARLIARKSLSSKSVRGSNLAFRKKDFELVNGYDNDLTGWGHEDEELATRFVNSGIYKKVVKLAAVQYHLHHKEASKNNEPIHADAVLKKRMECAVFCINGFQQI
ncbi:glycosyltransferase family 2 protein [Niabella yanshanensis]|uniref:Glycosyltransferase family 2 protein n=1 Tax=Niabella yanshanensis TaxID=577386 RepID=A0ABZ0W333_9BACT|nr:glycosyltransferase family 2 protein [Niabella yanshanensis]WQD36897.1 glycosyltransferase family 2 protein [Niabella yanshanensis]